MLVDILSFFPRTEKWQSTKSERKNESRDYLLKKDMYIYTSSLFIKYETRQYILRKDESHFAMPQIVWYFSLRFDLLSFCLLFVVINISLFLFISIWFFYSYMFYLPPLNGCRYGEKPQSINVLLVYKISNTGQ